MKDKKIIKEKIEEKKKSKVFVVILDLIYIIVGTFLIALGTNMFLLPHKMTTGGASGIATIFYYLLNVPMGITVLLVNVPLFIVSIAKLGFKFNFKSIISTILLSVFLEIVQVPTALLNDGTDLFTSCIFGGLVVGLGLSVVFMAGCSSGGSDLLAQLIYKLTSVQSLSKVLLSIEVTVIVALIIAFKDINIGLYSIISIYISTKVVDIIYEGVYYTKVVTIITKKKDIVVNAILNDLKRGATITNSIGAHSGGNVSTITCVITRPQISKIKRLVKNNDPSAIMYITTVNEALGNGFKEFE